MFCNNCGVELKDGMTFCPNCGAQAAGEMPAGDDGKTSVLRDGDVQEQETAPSVEEKAEADPEEHGESIEEPTEKIEAVEISPTGVIGQGTAVAVPAENEQKKFCPNCGTQNGINDLFCQECGMFFGNEDKKMGAENGKVRPAGKTLKIVLAAVAAIVVLAGIGVFVMPRILGGTGGGNSERDFFVYLKDNELMMTKGRKFEPVLVGDRYLEDKDSIGVFSYYYNGVACSPDNKYIYYPQDYDLSKYAYDLYRRRINGKEEEEKIDSNVVDYKIIDNDRLAYIKDMDDRKLYLYDKGESQKVASDVSNISVSADGKYIMWAVADGDGYKYYVQDSLLKSDKIKLDSDMNIYGWSDGFETIVYTKDDNLYVLRNFEDKEKIASDVSQAYVYDINGRFKIYYQKIEDDTVMSLYDLVEDDCLTQDQNITEPNMADYQTITYVDSFWGMREKVELSDAYYEEYEKFEQKLNRDVLRDRLKNQIVDGQEKSFYYYDSASGESSELFEKTDIYNINFNDYSINSSQGWTTYDSLGTKEALLYLRDVDLEKMESPVLSKLVETDYSEIEKTINDRLADCVRCRYIWNGEIYELEEAAEDYDSSWLWADEDKKNIYLNYQFYSEGDSYNELYVYDYGKKDAAPELISDDLAYIADRNLAGEVCYVNGDDELYCGETMIDDDVYASSVKSHADGQILYLKDVDKDGEEGTLYLYQNGKSVKLADDAAVHAGKQEMSYIEAYGFFHGNEVVFLSDYNFNKVRGDLNVYNGKESVQVDTDVAMVLLYDVK